MSRLVLSGLLAALVAGCDAGSAVDEADLVLRDGKIVTVDPSIPEAQALAARDGRIVAVGSNADIDRFIGSDTEVVDLDGQLAIPGFIEGHAHFMNLGRSKLQLNLMDVANWDEVVNMVADAVANAEPGELITGRGWHQEKWDRAPEPNVEGLPFHESLSAVSPDNPVLLTHASGHATYANQKAMELSGIAAGTPDPAGGEIVRDGRGNPIGAFRETAARLLGPASEGAAEADPRRVALLAQEESFSKGVTSFQDAGSSFETVDLWRDMVDDGSLKIRLYGMIRASNESLAENLSAYRMVGHGDELLTIRSIKVSIDGALGSHGAWLLEPYVDLPSSAGLNTAPLDEVREKARLAMEHGYQLNVHAIGDRGNRETLDIFEQAFSTAGQGDYRWRIEHAQHLHPDDIPRFGELGVIAAMQGKHATSDGTWVPDRLGDQRSEEGAYVWKKLMESGAVVMNGTDAPVEDVSPIASYYSTVSRRLSDGTVFYPAQRMSRLEALESYTINAAYGAFEEGIKGSLTPGKLADITVLSQDIMAIEEDRIPETEVVFTIVGGEIVFARDGGRWAGPMVRLRELMEAEHPEEADRGVVGSLADILAIIESAKARGGMEGLERYIAKALPEATETEVVEAAEVALEIIESVPVFLVRARQEAEDRQLASVMYPLLDHAEHYYLQPMDLIPEMTQGLAGLLDDSYLVIRILQNLDKGPEAFLDWDLDYPLRFLKRLVGAEIGQRLDKIAVQAMHEVSVNLADLWEQMSHPA